MRCINKSEHEIKKDKYICSRCIYSNDINEHEKQNPFNNNTNNNSNNEDSKINDIDNNDNDKLRERLLNENLENVKNIKELNYQQKNDLINGIQLLEVDKLEPIIEMVTQWQEKQNNYECDDQYDELEIDIDQLPSQLQVDIYMYLLTTLRC